MEFRKRIQKLPKFYGEYVRTHAKQDADRLIRYFRTGVTNGTLRLEPLAPETLRRKVAYGCTHPASPLYGMGYEAAYTYIKGLRTFKTKDGWVVRMTGKNHGGVDNAQLLEWHENGTRDMPARPALRRAYDLVMSERRKRRTAREINHYLRTGKWKGR